MCFYGSATIHIDLGQALLNQARKSECGMAQMSSCIAGFNVLNMRYVRKTVGNQGLSQLEVIFILLVVTILGMVTVLCMVNGDCPNDSDHSIDGGYPCLLESSVSICHIIQYCEISPKKVGDHLWKMGDQKSIVTIRCNLAMSYNNGQRSLIFLNTTKQNEQTNKSHKAIY